ncbi:hypothetical protein QLX08_010314 [Tetragonisca angustula]|uniref:HTH CENPB-type domain-containing protein n=1 Tax=Tetragonisca angustula TaxID=166442 RepID=A0AAW0ZD63_9HYME
MASGKEINFDHENSEELLRCSKQEITDALEICRRILITQNLIEGLPNETIGRKSQLIGEEITKAVIKVLKDFIFENEEDCYLENEDIPEDYIIDDVGQDSPTNSEGEDSPDINISSSNSSAAADSFQEHEPKKSRISDFVPLDRRLKIINIARQHPKWSLQTLQRHGCQELRRKDYLQRWIKEIKGVGVKESFDYINKYTYDRFTETRNDKRPVTTRMLQQWASAAALPFQSNSFHFTASESWVKKFKSTHKISLLHDT